MTPDPARGELAPQPDRPRGSRAAVPGVADRLAGLADWIDQRLSDEDYDRQVIAETVAVQLRELAAFADTAEHGAQRPVTAAQPGRAAAAAILRAAAGLIETRTDIPQPYARVHFILTRGHPAIADAVTAIAAAVPGQWQAKLRHSAGYGDSLDLIADLGPASMHGRTEIQVSAPAEAVCTETGTTTVTAWEPGPVITPFLGGTPVQDQRRSSR